MAEFQEVMRQLGMICTSNYGECDICDLHSFCPWRTFIGNYETGELAERLEKMVVSWATEHQEPVYPTWGDYLLSIGVVKTTPDDIPVEPPNGDIMKPSKSFYIDLNANIKADIARKLGIEPVPIIHGDCRMANEADARKKPELS